MKKTITLAALAAGLMLTGCDEQAKDAPRGVEDTAPADVLQFPDGFSNVAFKCNGSDMVYSSTNGADTRAAIAVRADDPRCAR